ncbi:MAG: hypothetical protein JNJ54_16765 [Myxococcaceae bacterium]|nr:hypothetical protein [Myxococcaceae bacterium]
MLRPVALAWLLFEGAWALFMGLTRWSTPEGPVWLMDVGLVYLVARLLLQGATPGRALLLVVGMFVWAVTLFIVTPGCFTRAWLVGQQAAGLVAVKAVMLLSAACWRAWRNARRRARVQTSGPLPLPRDAPRDDDLLRPDA